MDCNNNYCYWNGCGNQCLHESEEGHKKAKANMLDCPSSLRSDFEEEMHKCYIRLHFEMTIRKIDPDFLRSLNFKRLRKLEKDMKEGNYKIIEITKEVDYIKEELRPEIGTRHIARKPVNLWDIDYRGKRLYIFKKNFKTIKE